MFWMYVFSTIYCFLSLIYELECVVELLQSKHYANMYAIMEFWLNSNMIHVIIARQILYLQNNIF
jgi:hypothetical protein